MKYSYYAMLDELNLKMACWTKEIFDGFSSENSMIDVWDRLCKLLDQLDINYAVNHERSEIMASIEGALTGLRICFCTNNYEISNLNELPSGVFLNEKSWNRQSLCMQLLIGLGVAFLLSKQRKFIPGAVNVLFQLDSQVMAPDRNTFLEEPKADAVMGLLFDSDRVRGKRNSKITISPISFLYSLDEWEFTVKGRGGHAAYPHKCIDPVSVACRILNTFNNIIDREKDPVVPAKIIIKGIHSDSRAFNIISDNCKATGAVIALSESCRSQIEQRIREIVSQFAILFKTEIEISFSHGYPSFFSDSEMTNEIISYAEENSDMDLEFSEPIHSKKNTNFAGYAMKIPGIIIKINIPEATEPYRIEAEYMSKISTFATNVISRWLKKLQ